jgi:hypothetical protein
MHLLFNDVRHALMPITLGATLIALPGLASAGAVTSATAVALFERLDFDPNITVTYELDTAETVSSTSTQGSAVASTLQTPDTSIDEELFFRDQDAQSQAEAYKTGKASLGSASAAISNVAYVVMENTGTSNGSVTLGWEYTLEAIQTVTGIHSFASAFAYAQIVMFDDAFLVDVDEFVQALYGTSPSTSLADDGDVTFDLAVGESNVLTIQLITEADAQFVPVPATAALLALGLLGLSGIRRRPAA